MPTLNFYFLIIYPVFNKMLVSIKYNEQSVKTKIRKHFSHFNLTAEKRSLIDTLSSAGRTRIQFKYGVHNNP